jgi:phosphoglycerate dehydrogenase-like enzyme
MTKRPRLCVWPPTSPQTPASNEEIAATARRAGADVVAPAAAEAMVWTDWRDGAGLAAVLHNLPGLRWIQLVTSGVDDVAALIPDGRIWTSAKGAYAFPIAEFVLGNLVAGMRSTPGYARARRWEVLPARSLRHARVTVVGGGGIAAALVELLAPWDCEVTVVRRSNTPLPGARRTVGPERLPRVCTDTDVLVLALALTPRTTGLVDAGLLASLPSHGWLVNVARGAHVRTDDLTDALASGRLAGAILDVTDPEPLPASHPLWVQPNCLITPHAACPGEIGRAYLLERVAENVQRFSVGGPMLGTVDPTAGY